ncbi:MAG TPA: GspH/FimT family pseudopilin [Steroidobacter sp.]|uniref:GspH/FimT family pseudopilin n=1 Tax=Steroidobacter sp. TaxID=1978227 RepID=UPI002ED88F22
MLATRLPRSRGVTLLEMMITLAVSAVLLGLAVPSFAGMWLDSQRAVAVNALIHGIFLARTTAVVRKHVVSICRSSDGQTCSNQFEDWQHGWIVFVNHDRDDPPVRDPGEPVLAVQAPWKEGTITSNRRAYSFRSFRHRVVNGTLVFCDRRGSAQARAIIINSAGRPRVSKRDSDNRPLRCPSG